MRIISKTYKINFAKRDSEQIRGKILDSSCTERQLYGGTYTVKLELFIDGLRTVDIKLGFYESILRNYFDKHTLLGSVDALVDAFPLIFGEEVDVKQVYYTPFGLIVDNSQVLGGFEVKQIKGRENWTSLACEELLKSIIILPGRLTLESIAEHLATLFRQTIREEPYNEGGKSLVKLVALTLTASNGEGVTVE